MTGGMSLKTSVMPAALQTSVKASVAYNVSLIKSIPAKYFDAITGDIMRAVTIGAGVKDIFESLDAKLGDRETQSLNQAKNMADDQARKVYNNINKERMQAIGLTQFEWVHSGGGQHPRETHMEWDGQIFSFDDLPIGDNGEPVKPSDEIGCRCTMLPVLNFGAGNDQ
jgi:SPP1 gp7 family putative phage head morphogenesis protein